MKIYVVKQGDSVDSIADSQGIPVETLVWANQIEYPYRLAVGQALYISDGETREGRRPLFSSGYAYPFIDSGVLEDTLPYLSAVNVFSYGFTEDGNLVLPMTDDAWIIEKALQWGVRPVLTLTPLGENGHFNNNLVSVLVRSRENQQRLIWELGRTMQEKGYGGLDIDFEYVLAEDRAEYADFVRRATQVLNIFGYTVTVALAPKTSAQQRGLLYEGIDYRLLGEAANHVMLMTYEWGYSQGPPMAVAPINMVRKVVEYAVSEIPPEKIILGIPNYGYDWPLPFERGVTRARSLGTLEAVKLAVDFGVDIRFDETAMSPYFRYWQYGIQHEVWYEDARSIRAKFDLIKEFNLYGAGYWQLMRFFRANWLLMDDMFYIERDWPLMKYEDMS